MSEVANKETIITEENFMYSIPYFFINSKFKLTNKRIEGEVPNLLFFIPTGKDNATYPLNNISGVKISTKFYLKSFIIGFILSLIGLGAFSDSFFAGLLTTGLGLSILLNAFRTLLVIQNNAGSSMSYPVAPIERSKAQQFVNKVNDVIAERI